MDFVFWIILIVLIVGVVWWLLNRRNASDAGSSAPLRREGGLAGGSAAASAEAAGTTGLPSAAGFGKAAEPVPPTTADDEPEISGTPAHTAEHTAAEHHAEPAAEHGAEPTAAQRGAGPETAAAPGAAAGVGRDADMRQDADVVEASATPDAVDASAEPGTAATQEPGASAEPQAAEPSTSRPAATEPSDTEPSATQPPATQLPATGMPAPGTPASSQESAGTQADDAEWETQWSEASGSTPAATSPRPAMEETTGTAGAPAGAPPSTDAGHVHHHEYTAPHAPTLPGAETAAAETASAETDAAEQTAATDYEPAPQPTGHLAADEPYGAGSASPGPDGSGPADFTVKGDAGSMVYYEEGHPDYEQAKADVWFESEAHAEAAGFRAPRRTRS